MVPLNEEERPVVELVGSDGNVFNLLGMCRRALKNAGLGDYANELISRVTDSSSYTEALGIMMEYCRDKSFIEDEDA